MPRTTQPWFKVWGEKVALSDDLNTLTDHEERVWWRLLCAASVREPRWSVPRSPALIERCRSTPVRFAAVIASLTRRGMIRVDEGVIEILNWRSYQEGQSAERMRRHRAQLRDGDAPVTAQLRHSDAHSDVVSDAPVTAQLRHSDAHSDVVSDAPVTAQLRASSVTYARGDQDQDQEQEQDQEREQERGVSTPPGAQAPLTHPRGKSSIVELTENERIALCADFPEFDIAAELENCRNLKSWEHAYKREYTALRNRLRLRRTDAAPQAAGGTQNGRGNAKTRGSAAPGASRGPDMEAWKRFKAGGTG